MCNNMYNMYTVSETSHHYVSVILKQLYCNMHIYRERIASTLNAVAAVLSNNVFHVYFPVIHYLD